jgi:hypothetical protein
MFRNIFVLKRVGNGTCGYPHVIFHVPYALAKIVQAESGTTGGNKRIFLSILAPTPKQPYYGNSMKTVLYQ